MGIDIYCAMAGNYAQCNCDSAPYEPLFGFGALRGQIEARNFYGDKVYEAIAKSAKERVEQERTRLSLIRRGDFIDDVASQLQPEN